MPTEPEPAHAPAQPALEPAPLPGRRRTLLTASAWAVLEKVLRMAIALVSVPLTLGYLGTERYGLWMTAQSLNQFMSFLHMGLTPTLQNRMAEAHAKGDTSAFNHNASGSLAVTMGLIAFAVLAGIVGAQLDWPALLRVTEPVARAEATPVAVVMLVIGIAHVGLLSVDSVFNARMMLVTPVVWSSISTLVTFGFLLLGIHLRWSLPLLAGASASQAILCRLPLIAELMVREPQVFRPRWSALPALLRQILPNSLLFTGIQAAFIAIGALPNLLIALKLSLSDVAAFSVVSRLMSIPLLLITALLPVFWPAFSAAWARGERDWLRRHLRHLLLGTAAVVTAFGVATTLFGDRLITLWTQGQTSANRLLLSIMACWLLIQTLVNWVSTFLHSITDFRFELICFAASLVLFVATAIPLLGALALPGLALAMAVSLLIGSLLPMWLRVRGKLAS